MSYAHKWAFGRNPRYGAFDEIGGDCANFVSQALYAGCGAMNYQKDVGWHYAGMGNRNPAWTSVYFQYRFLTTNLGPGPYAAERPLAEAQIGDIVQVAFLEATFTHSCVVVQVGAEGSPDDILVAAHTADCDNRPLSTYAYRELRLLHIMGVRP